MRKERGEKVKEKPKQLSLAVVSTKKAGMPGSAAEIAKEAKKFFASCDLLNLTELKVGVNSSTNFLESYDAVYLRGSYRYAKLLSSLAGSLTGKAYMPVSAEAFLVSHDKFLTLLKLQEARVPVPTSYLVYSKKAALEAIEKMNYPIVFKLLSGTQGKGVMFVDSKESALSAIDMIVKVSNFPLLIQDFVETGGKDIRVLVIGKKVFAIERKAERDELRANIHRGAEARPAEIDYDTEHMAIRAANAVGAKIAAVDILDDGTKRYVIEVNVSPGLLGISAALKINLAAEVASFLYRETKLSKEAKEAETEKIVKLLRKEKELATELITNADIKGAVLKLPEAITKASKISPGDEITVKVVEGKIVVERKEESKE